MVKRTACLAFLSWITVFSIVTLSKEAKACNPACTGVTPICNAGVCLACTSNFGSVGLLACPTASAPYCQLSDSGSLGGSCTQCGPGDLAQCDATHPACLSDGTCGCDDPSQCASGSTCDTASNTCVPASDGGGGADAGGASDSGGGVDGATEDGGTPEDGGGAEDGGTGGDGGSAQDGGASGDAGAADATIEDGAVADGAVVDGAGSQTGDATIAADGGSEDGGGAGEGDAAGEGGAAGNGEYILGGGCSCVSAPRSGPEGSSGWSALVALGLACAVTRRRRGR